MMSTGEIVAIVEDRCLNDPVHRHTDPDGDVGNGPAAARAPEDPAVCAGSVVRTVCG